MPKWMANAMESVLKSLYFECRVEKITYWNTELLQIEFKTLEKIPAYKFGDAVSIRVSDTQFRNYTPVVVIEKANVFYILFHLHPGTLGNDYIENLKAGDILKMVIPRGRCRVNELADSHVVVTDETGLGFAFSLLEKQRSTADKCFVISETSAVNTAIIADCFKPSINTKKGQIEQALQLFFDDYYREDSQTQFYLIGNAKTIQQSLSFLKQRGIRSPFIYSQPFWALGKIGL